MDLVLYGNPASGHSYKAALFLALAEIPYEYRWVDLKKARAERSADFVAASPYGEVPLLVTDGDVRGAIAQSNAILLHLARVTGKLLEPAHTDRATTWLFWEANRIGFSVPNLRFARRFRPDTKADVIAWIEDRALEDLTTLDRTLGDRAFLLGDRPSIADLSCAAYLFWLDQAGLDKTRWPAVTAWLDRIAALPGYETPEALLARR